MSTSCSAYQGVCQNQCRADYPVWKIGKRKECQAACDVQYATCIAELQAQYEETSTDMATEQQATIKTVIIASIALIIIIFLVFIWLKTRKG